MDPQSNSLLLAGLPVSKDFVTLLTIVNFYNSFLEAKTNSVIFFLLFYTVECR